MIEPQLRHIPIQFVWPTELRFVEIIRHSSLKRDSYNQWRRCDPVVEVVERKFLQWIEIGKVFRSAGEAMGRFGDRFETQIEDDALYFI